MNERELDIHRHRTLDWAFDLMQRDFVVLDTETTGIGPRDQVVQVAVIDRSGEPLIVQTVRPTVPIAPDASRVHGLTAASLAGAPLFSAFHADLAAHLKGRIVVVYNADFDRRILKQTCAALTLAPLQAAAWECAMQRFAAYYGQWNSARQSFTWKRLTEACAHLDLPIEDAHSALGDARLTLALVQKMASLSRLADLL